MKVISLEEVDLKKKKKNSQWGNSSRWGRSLCIFIFLMRALCLILVQLYQYRVCLLNNVLGCRLIRFNIQYKTIQILSAAKKRSRFFLMDILPWSKNSRTGKLPSVL